MKIRFPRWASAHLLVLAVWTLGACTVMRRVERLVPEIPEIVLIGGKRPAVDPADPSTLIPDSSKDAVVFRFEVQGQARRVVIQLYPLEAPMTVANFQQRVRSGHYEGLAVHRAIPNYLVQVGDPQSRDPETRAGWGTGGLETTLPAEIKLPHRPGAVGMARLGDAVNPARASSGSQFYVAMGDMSRFDGDYTVFGQVIEGYEVLQEITTLPADENDNPYQRVEIESAHLDKATRFVPQDIGTVQRETRRRRVEEMPPPDEAGTLERLWRRIW